MHKVLLVDKQTKQDQTVKEFLQQQGNFEVIESYDKNVALTLFQKNNPNLVIIESLHNAVSNDLALAQKMLLIRESIPIIIISPSYSLESVLKALQIGIKDFIKYPFQPKEILESLKRCLPDFQAKDYPTQKKSSKYHPTYENNMIGEHPSIQETKKSINIVAPTESNVLITGETGTGKELVAELIHKKSERSRKPFVCINCTAIPETLLESELFGHERGAFTGANVSQEGLLKQGTGGTVFFDEIGDMSLYNQAKILRVIESKEIQRLGGHRSAPLDIRIIAATNQDLDQLMTEGKFRKDLYFRLNISRIHLPPLRERREDIPLLLDHFIQNLNHQFHRSAEGFTDDAMDWLVQYYWPGNVREMKNLLETIFVYLTSQRISLKDIPEHFRNRLANINNLPKDEQEQLLSALLSTNWNISKAAIKLRWSRMTMYRKMQKYHITKYKKNTKKKESSQIFPRKM
ncbi:MAG: sigma 54-interacting transcriptional regulator [Candidatus Kuenenia sp.]|nr:sigma 54-interacting transcriptional regulator [Candidatus Kuenenia hertensis]